MQTYIVAFDGEGIDEDYAGLVTQLCEFLAPCRRILDNTWLVQSNLLAEDILKVLKPHMPLKRGLLVARISDEVAWTGFGKQETRLMREFL